VRRLWPEAIRRLSLFVEGLIGERLKRLLGGH
jgi:hypothetical protein